MKVLLMVAPSADALTLENSNDIAQNMGFFPPLGILYIGTYLRNNSEHDVRVIDSESERLTYEVIEERIINYKPDVIGITAFTNTLKSVIDIVKIAKRVCPDCLIILGGPHVPLYMRESVEIEGVDYAINGDGEYAFKKLLDILENGSKENNIEAELKKVDGIVFKASDGELYNNGYARIDDIDSLPFPDRSFLIKELYFCILGKNRMMTTIMSSRGCPFQCTFCNTPDKVFRYRSPQNVVDEMEYIASTGVEEIFFFDDLFNINAERGINICDEILERGINVKWAFRGRVTGISEEFIKKAKQAGCERIQFGIEKATDESLKKVKKASTVKDVISAVNLAKKYGIMCVGNFLLFTPGECEEDAEEIIKFSLKLKLDHAEYSVFIPYPGTQIYEEGLKSGFFEKDYWAEYVRNPDTDFQLIWEEKVPKERMYSITSKAHKRFYFRPRIIWNELKRMSSWKELKRNINGARIILNLK